MHTRLAINGLRSVIAAANSLNRADDRQTIVHTSLKEGVVPQPGNADSVDHTFSRASFIIRLLNKTDNVYDAFPNYVRLTYTTPAEDWTSMTIRDKDRGTNLDFTFKPHQIISMPPTPAVPPPPLPPQFY